MAVSKDFVLAGKATFTVACPDGTHRTYRVTHKPADGQYPEAWFVKVLTGPDNTSSYTYVGKLDPFTGQVKPTAKSKFAEDSHPVRLFNRVMARIWTGDHAAYEQHGYATHHEGKCGRCGRALTVPQSVETGIGPECAGMMGMPHVKPTGKKAKDKGGTAVAEKPVGTATEPNDSWDLSDRPYTDVSGLTPVRDEEGDIQCWIGILGGRKVTVFND